MVEEQQHSRGEMTNRAFRTVLLGVEEIAGNRGMAGLLRQANLAQYINNYPPSNLEYGGHLLEYVAQLNRALFDIYGARGARAILRRVGLEQAKNALRENVIVTNATSIALKFLSRQRRAKMVLDTVAKEYSQQLHTTIKVVEEGGAFYWEDPNCNDCIGWASESPVCFVMAGFLHGMVAWATGSEEFKVEEIECRAKSAPACKYRVTLIAE